MAEAAPDIPICVRCKGEGTVYGEGPCPDCHEYDPASYSAEREYDAIDLGPVPETDPEIVEALLWEQLNHLKEVGFPSG